MSKGESRFQIKTGVIGVGSMGKNHARIYDEISNLIAVYINEGFNTRRSKDDI